jgi:hypothetical protein
VLASCRDHFHHKSTYRRINWFLPGVGMEKIATLLKEFPGFTNHYNNYGNDEDFLNGLLSLLCICDRNN